MVHYDADSICPTQGNQQEERMARIHQITGKEDVPKDKHHIVDSIVGSRGRVSGPFSVLLHSPEVAGRAAHLGAYLRFDSTLPDGLREVAINTAAREFDCGYEWAAHARMAKEVGVSDKTLDVIARRGNPSSLEDDEALVIRYGRELFRNHRVSDETYKAAEARFGVQGVVELTATMGYY
ncbi:MAG: carboxymuconolactone decarboxylase family protein, partial [Chloroflexi bacterium]|nr:carboxymuconolactone decarboxylase family protein [Chloroflexota bacterium]